jgi:hypothetical protein
MIQKCKSCITEYNGKVKMEKFFGEEKILISFS